MEKLTVMKAVFLVGLLTIVGCATMRERAARSQEDLMIASGFVPRIAGTPEEKAQLQSMTPLRMYTYVNNNTFTYAFPDPQGCNCVYVGNQTQYAAYRKLAIQKEIAEEYLEAQQWSYSYPPYWGGWYPYGGAYIVPHNEDEERHEEH